MEKQLQVWAHDPQIVQKVETLFSEEVMLHIKL